MTDEQVRQQIDALREERRGYEVRLVAAKEADQSELAASLKERMAAVDGALARLAKGKRVPAESAGTVQEVLEQVGDDPAKAKVALEAEQAKGKGARVSLVKGLSKVIAAVEGEQSPEKRQEEQ